MTHTRSGIGTLLVVCILLIGWFARPAAAGSFQDANLFYKNNQYDQAIETYEKIIRDGFESGNLYYNLGNSYFKKGDLGRALLNYERAKFFIPHDGDLRSNHDFVRGVLNVPSRYSSEFWFFRWLDRLFDGIGMNSLTALVSSLWILILVLLSMILWLPAVKRFAAPSVVILAMFLAICSLALSRKIGYYEHGAIVIGREVEAKFGPSAGATTYFKVSEGNSVSVLDQSTDWLKIKRQDNKIGWVLRSEVGFIAPHKGA